MEIYKVITFDAAHKLPNVPEGHPCGRLHGHTYRVEIHISGSVDKKSGWVIDFAEIKKAASPVIEELDHYCLNEIKGLENPTSENIARWIWGRIRKSLPFQSKIVVQETPQSCAIYKGEDE